MKAEFKSDYQRALEVIENCDLSIINNICKNAYTQTTMMGRPSVDENPIAEILLELVRDNSNDFTRDIATKTLNNKYNLSEKQAWCVAYQIKNNNEVYILALNEIINK